MSLKPKILRPSARTGTGLTMIDAPWRHRYFEQPKDTGCFICRAIAAPTRQDPKNLVLVRGKLGIIMLNRYPYTMGALMIAPIAHIGRFQDIDDETSLELNRLVKKGMAILDAALCPRGYNVGINQGLEAGAGLLDHLHIHLVPRWGADTNFMTTTGGARVMAQDVDSMYRRLRRVKQALERKSALR